MIPFEGSMLRVNMTISPFVCLAQALPTQRNQWVNQCGSPGRDVSGQQSDSTQNHTYKKRHGWAGRFSALLRRANARTRETAIRSALGAGRRRISSTSSKGVKGEKFSHSDISFWYDALKSAGLI
jgi:hypothetical protein